MEGYLDSDNKGKWKVFSDYYLESNLQQRDATETVCNTRSVREGGYRVLDHYKLP